MHNHYSVQPGYSVTRQRNKHLQDLALPGGYHSHATASSSSPQQFLGGTAWQPQYSKPPQAYENYGEISACMHIKPHENKAFIGSSMSPGNKKKIINLTLMYIAYLNAILINRNILLVDGSLTYI